MSRKAKAKEKAKGKSSSWRDIQQSGGRGRVASPTSRKRQALRVGKLLGVMATASVLIAGVVYAVYFTHENFYKVSPVSREEPLRDVVFESDGVLNRDWMLANVEVEMQTNIMEFDIHRLKKDLEAFGQVRRADVSLRLPDTIIVQIKEREPILRARVPTADGRGKTVLIADDGVVFDGHRYPASTLRRLPGVAGIRLKKSDDGFDRVAGMPIVAELIRTAKVEWPHLFQDWRVVSLRDFSEDPNFPKSFIVVRGRYVAETVFAPAEFTSQLARLNALVGYSRANGQRGIERVDLSLESQTVAKY